MHRLAQSPFPLRHGGGGGGGGGGVSRLWRSNCEPHCFSVPCNWLAAAGPVEGRLTKLENNEPAGKQYLDDSTARSLPFPLRPPPLSLSSPLITSLHPSLFPVIQREREWKKIPLVAKVEMYLAMGRRSFSLRNERKHPSKLRF